MEKAKRIHKICSLVLTRLTYISFVQSLGSLHWQALTSLKVGTQNYWICPEPLWIWHNQSLAFTLVNSFTTNGASWKIKRTPWGSKIVLAPSLTSGYSAALPQRTEWLRSHLHLHRHNWTTTQTSAWYQRHRFQPLPPFADWTGKEFTRHIWSPDAVHKLNENFAEVRRRAEPGFKICPHTH